LWESFKKLKENSGPYWEVAVKLGGILPKGIVSFDLSWGGRGRYLWEIIKKNADRWLLGESDSRP